jgi:hypothetical protein
MTPFTHALVAPEAIPKYAEKLKLYGQFVGSWEAEAQAFLPDGATRRHYWLISFDWVLEGRAIQDVWITPPRHGAHAGQSERWGHSTTSTAPACASTIPRTTSGVSPGSILAPTFEQI